MALKIVIYLYGLANVWFTSTGERLPAMTEMEMDEQSREVVLSCVTKGLSTIGAAGAEATFYHIEQQFGLAKQSIPSNPLSFANSLRALFGVGSGVLLKAILDEVRSTKHVRIDKHVALFASTLEEAAAEVDRGVM